MQNQTKVYQYVTDKIRLNWNKKSSKDKLCPHFLLMHGYTLNRNSAKKLIMSS